MGLLNFWKKKAKPVKKRNYAAAQVNRLTNSWVTQPLSTDEAISRNLRILRARSREQSQNNDYSRRFIGLIKSNVIGPGGITMQARTVNATGKTDSLANDALESAWKIWGRSDNCDVTGSLSWVQQQNMFLQTVAIDGEILIRVLVGPSRGPYNFQLQFIDPELLDVDYNQKLRGGNYIKMGIEFNTWGKPVAYHLIDLDNNKRSYAYRGRQYIRIPADQIIHRFLPEKLGQKRGIPWASTAMLRMNMLGGYEEAALIAARVGAAKMGFFETPTGEEYTGDDTDYDGNLIMDAEAGTFEQLPAGIKFNSYDPQYPHGEFKDFVKTILRGISSGLGVSYNTLSNDLEGVNFSSIRTGVLEDREIWKALQEWVIEALCVPVYERWLNVQLAFGNIRINGTPLKIELADKYKAVSWQGRRWAWVDPLKDVQANIMAIEKGLKTRSEVIREQGRDPDEVWQELEKEKQKLEEIGLMTEPAQAGFLMGGEDE